MGPPHVRKLGRHHQIPAKTPTVASIDEGTRLVQKPGTTQYFYVPGRRRNVPYVAYSTIARATVNQLIESDRQGDFRALSIEPMIEALNSVIPSIPPSVMKPQFDLEAARYRILLLNRGFPFQINLPINMRLTVGLEISLVDFDPKRDCIEKGSGRGELRVKDPILQHHRTVLRVDWLPNDSLQRGQETNLLSVANQMTHQLSKSNDQEF